MKCNYDSIKAFDNASAQWLARNKGGKETKFGYSLNKIIDQIKKIFQDENKPLIEKLNDLTFDSYSTYDAGDMKGCLIKDDKGRYMQTPTNVKKLNKLSVKAREDHETKLGAKDFNITPHMATEVPEDLTAEEKKAFKGYDSLDFIEIKLAGVKAPASYYYYI